jgi:hypothetical protein
MRIPLGWHAAPQGGSTFAKDKSRLAIAEMERFGAAQAMADDQKIPEPRPGFLLPNAARTPLSESKVSK